MKTKISIWEKLKAFHLKNNVVVLVILIGIFLISLFAYLQPELREDEVLSNIALALFTSLLATIFAMSAEIYVTYKNALREKIFEDIHVFGIGSLNFQKDELLKKMLQMCDKEIWISGYRLILTNNIKADIANAIKRGASVKIVVCPPWSKAFQLVYGTHEKVIDNYYTVFHAIYEVVKEYELKNSDYRVYFIEKPIFSDTYKVDQNLVTGPYLHNKDKEYNRLMAKDFFSYILVHESPLYCLVKEEYMTLMEEAEEELDWIKFDAAYKEMYQNDYNEYEKTECLRKACIQRTTEKQV